jgi:Flp pilus assembly protein TadD
MTWASGVVGSARTVFEPELHQTWDAAYERGHHAENLQMVEGMLDVRPDDPDLHILHAMSLRALDRDDDVPAAVHRAIDCGEDDAAVMTRAASMCFYQADLETARRCVDRAKEIKPRDFPLKKELREHDRNLGRREKALDLERSLSSSFNAEPRDRRVAIDFARHLVRTGRAYTAYHVVSRGLLYHPDDRSLRLLERKLRKTVPDEERTEAKEWAASGEPTTNMSWRPVGGSGPREEIESEAERRQDQR